MPSRAGAADRRFFTAGTPDPTIQILRFSSPSVTPRAIIRLMKEGDMAVDLKHDPVLSRFRAALEEMYGDRIDRFVLFGSRARGDAHAESDYDVAVFLKELPDRWPELNRLV